MTPLFKQAVSKLLMFEGSVFVNHPSDSGGGTKYGISTTQYPSLDITNLTQDHAESIYYEDYWADLYEEIWWDELSIGLFILSVNVGSTAADLCLQKALVMQRESLIVDGIAGPKTVNALNKHIYHSDNLYYETCEHRKGKFLLALLSEITHHYATIVKNDPSQSVFISGWMHRAFASFR